MSTVARIFVLIAAAAWCAPISAQAPAPAATPAPATAHERLQRELARLAETSGGKVGVAAVHLESGRSVQMNTDDAYPMASTFKVPVALQLLRRVDRGEVKLETMITLAPSDIHPGSGEISHLLDDPGVSLSLRNLLELMMIISDNSATDLVMKSAGGAEAVTARVRELGVQGVRVDRPTVNLIADWAGLKLPPESEWTPQWFREQMRPQPGAPPRSPEERRRAAEAFEKDPRDTATPAGMVMLLGKLWRGEALTPESTALLLDIMKRCETGAARIKGVLPPQTEVMHKTGTIGGTTNDTGIIVLPDNAGHVAIAVFIKESRAQAEPRERAIAQISRAIYDYFLFSGN